MTATSADLWTSVETGDAEQLRALSNADFSETLDVNARRDQDGFNPLILASRIGNIKIVDQLLELGADENFTDSAGWTAREHAAFQGHLAIAQKLSAGNSKDLSDGPGKETRTDDDLRKFGFDRDESHVILNLGVTQLGNTVPVIDLPGVDLSNVSLEIYSTEVGSSKHRINLPIAGDLVDNTMIFPIADPSKARLNLRLLERSTFASAEHAIDPIGSGTALLSDERDCYGANRESLVREHIIPIISTSTFDCMGTITVTFVLAKPYPHFKTPHWDLDKELKPPRLVGHRGLGMNDNGHGRLQIGENTVESFKAAAKLGATFVEFDIQVTRDLVPILLHNYALSETGTDIPVHELTIDQFLFVSKKQSPHGYSTPISPDGSNFGDSVPRPHRSRSVSLSPETGAEEVRERMQFTVEYMQKGWKANTRGHFIQDTFATLADALRNVAEDVAFNIELKYPRRFETQGLNLAPVVIELNAFLDSVLDVIHNAPENRKRKIILSSFTPDVCILLSLKQKAFPIFLISNVGNPLMSDKEPRGASMRVAVKFAQRWELRGVVFLGDIFLLCPRLVKWIKNRGLIVGSYGMLNNEPENVKIQLEAGIDLIYTDRVGLNAKMLKNEFGVGQQTKI